MEGGKVIIDRVNCGRAIGSSGDGRPPIPFPLAGDTTAHQHYFEICWLSAFIYELLGSTHHFGEDHIPAISVLPILNGDNSETGFIPLLRSGAWADIGSRSSMEDVYVCLCADNLMRDYGLSNSIESPSAFYGVFDGHGGKHAADFACYHLPRFVFEDKDFPQDIERVITSAFLHTDTAFAEACSSDVDLDFGTTALAAVVIGRSLVVVVKQLRCREMTNLSV